MDDEAVIAELVQVRGIGRWTAEMLLMFSLLRPNVLPVAPRTPAWRRLVSRRATVPVALRA
jgi:endonuclease III